ncbi:MAG TPA: VOC family protein [Dehalococcoidia bacterium]|nr:VOC family protein [Dehalococcoidia bacterium]
MLRMRQICLVASDLQKAEEDLSAVFGLAVCHRDAGVEVFGLRNFLMPVGNNFLEVVAPFREGTAAGRYLERRGGDGGYMVIMQTDDVLSARERVLSMGIRLVLDDVARGRRESAGIQLHPRDVPGAIVELRQDQDDASPDGPWRPAGPDWKAARTGLVRAMTAAEVQTDDPPALARRWGEVIERAVSVGPRGPEIALDDAVLRFVPARDGRGEGLAGLDFEVADRARIMQAALARGCVADGDTVVVCGVRFRLIERR